MFSLSLMIIPEAEEAFIEGDALIAAELLLLFIIVVANDDIMESIKLSFILVFLLKVKKDGVVDFDSYIIELNMSISFRGLLSLFSNVS